MELRETIGQKVARHAFLIVIILAIALLFFAVMRRAGLLDINVLRSFILSAGPWAPALIILLIAVFAVSITIPSTPAIILAGALFGPLVGGVYAWIGIMIGSSFAFFVSRYFRQYIIAMLGDHAEVLVRFQQKYVAWVIFVTRAVPIFSFEIVSYASGLTGISYRAYALATGVGILPSVILLATSGHMLLEFGSGFMPIAMAVSMLLLIFIVPLLIDHYNPWGWKEKLLKAKHVKTAAES